MSASLPSSRLSVLRARRWRSGAGRRELIGSGRWLVRPRLEALEDRTLLSIASVAGPPLVWQNNHASAAGFLFSPNEADLYAVNLGAGDVAMAQVDAQDAGSA